MAYPANVDFHYLQEFQYLNPCVKRRNKQCRVADRRFLDIG